MLGPVVQLPFLTRPVCLPVLDRLHRPGTGPPRAEQAARMIRLLSACHHRRHVHVVADAAHHGRALRACPATSP